MVVASCFCQLFQADPPIISYGVWWAAGARHSRSLGLLVDACGYVCGSRRVYRSYGAARLLQYAVSSIKNARRGGRPISAHACLTTG